MPKALSIDEFKKSVGQIVGESSWITIEQNNITEYGKLVRDDQWIHTDPERCKLESPYGTTVGYGTFNVALLTYMLKEVITLASWSNRSIMCGFDTIKFTLPVLVGSKVKAVFKLCSVEQVEPNCVEHKWKVKMIRDTDMRMCMYAEWTLRNYISG